MSATEDQKIAKIITGTAALGFTRVFILMGFPAIMAISAYYGDRFVKSFDHITEQLERFNIKMNDQAAQIRLLEQTMQLRSQQRDAQVGEINGQIKDHETRIRTLEQQRTITYDRR